MSCVVPHFLLTAVHLFIPTEAHLFGQGFNSFYAGLKAMDLDSEKKGTILGYKDIISK